MASGDRDGEDEKVSQSVLAPLAAQGICSVLHLCFSILTDERDSGEPGIGRRSRR